MNECLIKNGGCIHTCENTMGSFRCMCNKGFQLLDDKRTCKGLLLNNYYLMLNNNLLFDIQYVLLSFNIKKSVI